MHTKAEVGCDGHKLVHVLKPHVHEGLSPLAEFCVWSLGTE